MPDLEEQLDTALSRIALSFEANRTEFGKTDFPQDCAVGFRNFLFTYPVSLANSINNIVKHHPTDQWVAQNLQLVSGWTDDYWWKIIGFVHIFAESRELFTEYQNLIGRNAAEPEFHSINVMEDWLFNGYELEPAVRTAWDRLIRSNIEAIAYQSLANDLLDKTISRFLGISINADHCWPGIGLHAAMNCPNPSEEWFSQFCIVKFDEAARILKNYRPDSP
jgi:hypothetical protein